MKLRIFQLLDFPKVIQNKANRTIDTANRLPAGNWPSQKSFILCQQ